jgi:hypothetical protein
MGWVVNAAPQPLDPWGRDPVAIIQEAVWTGAENIVPTGIRTPDGTAGSKSLSRSNLSP